MTLSKRPYMVDAMRCEVFVGYLGRPGFPSCRRSTSGGYYGSASPDANRDARLNNAQVSDGGLEEAPTVYDEGRRFHTAVHSGLTGLDRSWVGMLL